VKIVKHRNKLAGEVVESLFLEILKHCLDMVLSNQLSSEQRELD